MNVSKIGVINYVIRVKEKIILNNCYIKTNLNKYSSKLININLKKVFTKIKIFNKRSEYNLKFLKNPLYYSR